MKKKNFERRPVVIIGKNKQTPRKNCLLNLMRLFIPHYTYGSYPHKFSISRTLDLLTESASNLWFVISLLISSVEWYAHAVDSDAAHAER